MLDCPYLYVTTLSEAGFFYDTMVREEQYFIAFLLSIFEYILLNAKSVDLYVEMWL